MFALQEHSAGEQKSEGTKVCGNKSRDCDIDTNFTLHNLVHSNPIRLHMVDDVHFEQSFLKQIRISTQARRVDMSFKKR